MNLCFQRFPFLINDFGDKLISVFVEETNVAKLLMLRFRLAFLLFVQGK